MNPAISTWPTVNRERCEGRDAMTSLAEELDPAFQELSLSGGSKGHGRSGMPISQEEEDESYDNAYGRSVSSTSSTPLRASRPSRYRHRPRGASDVSTDSISIPNRGDGFSLADELGGGASTSEGVVRQKGLTLSDEFNEPPTLDTEKHHTPSHILDDETRSRRDQEHYLNSSEALSDSVRQTDRFLGMLRKMTDSTAASSSVQGNNTAPSTLSSSLSYGSLGGNGSLTDDTATIEHTAAGIVRQLREQAQLREGQVRELQECDRIIRRAFEEGGEYLIALAETEQADGVDEPSNDDKDPLGISFAVASIADEREHGRVNSTFDADDTFTGQLNGSVDDSKAPTTSPSTQDRRQQSPAFHDLVKLQHSTSDLVLSLGTIHEYNQIAHATLNDATRKLRNVRAVLTNWQDEVKLMEKSTAWIAAREASKDPALERPADVRRWMQDEMEQFEFALEEAHIKARELLKPVRDPVLDRLAASTA